MLLSGQCRTQSPQVVYKIGILAAAARKGGFMDPHPWNQPCVCGNHKNKWLFGMGLNPYINRSPLPHTKRKQRGETRLDRDTLIQQVKNEYARLADLESQAHVKSQSYSGIAPEAYYEEALEKAIRDITAGKYDNCISGLEVVEQIANHRTKAQRIQDNIESTLHNMEIAEEIIASKPGDKMTQDLRAENERRAEAIPQMIRDMKEEKAQEELDANSPKVIGGGTAKKKFTS